MDYSEQLSMYDTIYVRWRKLIVYPGLCNKYGGNGQCLIRK